MPAAYATAQDYNVKEDHNLALPDRLYGDADNAYALGTVDLFANTSPGPGIWVTMFQAHAGDPPEDPNSPGIDYPPLDQHLGQYGNTLIITPTQSDYELIVRVSSLVRAYLEDYPPNAAPSDTVGASLNGGKTNNRPPSQTRP